MKIHVADSSVERGQYQLLVEEKYTSSLLSYAYLKACGKHFEQYWGGLVKIHLAGLPSQNTAIQSQVLPEIESHLTTFANQNEINKKSTVWEMRIHLADTTAKLQGETNIKKLLPTEQKPDALFSYAYKEHEPMWRDSRNLALRVRHFDGTESDPAERLTTSSNDMHIHLAGHSATPEMESQVLPEHQSHLATYADLGEIKNKLPTLVDLRPRVIIDSGAFTAFTTGKTINPKEYAEWAIAFENRWQDRMQFLRFMNLDVIGDQAGSWKNQEILEALGMHPIPIVTYGAGKEHLIRALDNYEYIALGGLVPHATRREKLKSWLDYCFGIITPYFKKTGVMPKIHLLGITSEWTLQRYPCYSSDSSSWVQCLRFGDGKSAGIKKIPRYKESAGAMAATLHALRAEIQKYKKMEQDATNLWKKRGVSWDEL